MKRLTCLEFRKLIQTSVFAATLDEIVAASEHKNTCPHCDEFVSEVNRKFKEENPDMVKQITEAANALAVQVVEKLK